MRAALFCIDTLVTQSFRVFSHLVPFSPQNELSQTSLHFLHLLKHSKRTKEDLGTQTSSQGCLSTVHLKSTLRFAQPVHHEHKALQVCLALYHVVFYPKRLATENTGVFDKQHETIIAEACGQGVVWSQEGTTDPLHVYIIQYLGSSCEKRLQPFQVKAN